MENIFSKNADSVSCQQKGGYLFLTISKWSFFSLPEAFRFEEGTETAHIFKFF